MILLEFESNVFSINQEKNLRVTVSIEVAQYISGQKITAFIKRVDENMYVARSEGKNRIFFSQ
jgi:PleD family two-component response regulator